MTVFKMMIKWSQCHYPHTGESKPWCKPSLTYRSVSFDMCSNLKVRNFARKSGFPAPVGKKKSYNLSKRGLHSSVKQ